MRFSILDFRFSIARATAGFLVLAACGNAGAQTLSDVPASHWAHAAVADVVQRGVMKAPGGKFQGGVAVSRRELAISLAAFGKALEHGAWRGMSAKPLKAADDWKLPEKVTRYDLAVALSKLGRYGAAGLPKRGGKVFGPGEAMPAKPKLTVKPSDPAYAALKYLVDNRMAYGNSVVLKPGAEPVTGKQVAEALTQVIAGVNDRLTDEPQNREEIPERPAKPGR